MQRGQAVPGQVHEMQRELFEEKYLEMRRPRPGETGQGAHGHLHIENLRISVCRAHASGPRSASLLSGLRLGGGVLQSILKGALAVCTHILGHENQTRWSAPNSIDPCHFGLAWVFNSHQLSPGAFTCLLTSLYPWQHY